MISATWKTPEVVYNSVYIDFLSFSQNTGITKQSRTNWWSVVDRQCMFFHTLISYLHPLKSLSFLKRQSENRAFFHNEYSDHTTLQRTGGCVHLVYNWPFQTIFQNLVRSSRDSSFSKYFFIIFDSSRHGSGGRYGSEAIHR